MRQTTIALLTVAAAAGSIPAAMARPSTESGLRMRFGREYDAPLRSFSGQVAKRRDYDDADERQFSRRHADDGDDDDDSHPERRGFSRRSFDDDEEHSLERRGVMDMAKAGAEEVAASMLDTFNSAAGISGPPRGGPRGGNPDEGEGDDEGSDDEGEYRYVSCTIGHACAFTDWHGL